MHQVSSFKAIVKEVAARDDNTSTITDPLRRLLRACEADPAQLPALRDYASEAAKEGRIGTACVAMYWCGVSLSALGRSAEALAIIDAAEALAVQGRRLEAAEAAWFRAVVQKERGDHDGSCRMLISLLGDRRFPQLPLVRRVETLNQLAELCVAAQDADAALACTALAERECERDGVPMRDLFRTQRALIFLDLCMFGHAPFDAMLPSAAERGLSADQRAALLERATREFEDVLQSADDSMVGTVVTLANVGLWVIRALRSHSADAALSALGVLMTADQRNPDLERECRVRVLAALIVTGRLQEARHVVDTATRAVTERGFPTDRHRWLFLLSELSRATGQADLALQQYRDYTRAAGTHLPQMNLRVRELLQRVTKLPGARPADQPTRTPAYLEAAKRLLAKEGGTASVAEVASVVGVSERTLRDAFQVFERVSPKQYQARCRLDAVMQFLGSAEARELSVAEVAGRFGFSHPGRFAREFRDRFGVAVADARKGFAGSGAQAAALHAQP